MPLQLAISGFALSEVVDFLRKVFSDSGGVVTPSLHVNPILSMVSNLTSVVALAALVVTLARSTSGPRSPFDES